MKSHGPIHLLARNPQPAGGISLAECGHFDIWSNTPPLCLHLVFRVPNMHLLVTSQGGDAPEDVAGWPCPLPI